MQPDQVSPQAQMEALRRRAGEMPSSAGIPGGATTTNSLSPTNPIATTSGTADMTNPPTPTGGANGIPTGEAQSQLKREKGESRTIVDALIYRLKRSAPEGSAPTQ